MEKKLFSKTYNEVLLQAVLFHLSFLTYKDNFVAFSTQFDDPYAENLDNLIKEATLLDDYEYIKSISAVYSKELSDSLKLARYKYKELVYFLKLIYPNSLAVLNSFGYNSYDMAVRTPLRMQSLLEIAYNNANSEPYKSDLILAGYSQTNIDNLLNHANALNEKYLAHQQYLNDSSMKTSARIALFNNIWRELSKISNAAKLIFPPSSHQNKNFRLYK